MKGLIAGNSERHAAQLKSQLAEQPAEQYGDFLKGPFSAECPCKKAQN